MVSQPENIYRLSLNILQYSNIHLTIFYQLPMLFSINDDGELDGQCKNTERLCPSKMHM